MIGRRLPVVLLTALVITVCAASVAHAQWTTYHADPALSGVDPSSGTALPFAPAWAASGLGGSVWAEPLVYAGMVFVATENNDLYALSESSGAIVWHANAGRPVPAGNLPCGDIAPTVGITGTPVIDPATGVLYAVADVWNGSTASHELVAYQAATGKPVFSAPVDPAGEASPLNQLQREALALDDGRVLIGYGGNDGDCAQYRGYLVSAPENDIGPDYQYSVPTSREGAIWSGGGAPAVDAAGDAFVATGNAANGPGQSFDHGDTLEKLTADGAELDYWAPATWAQDSADDADLGSVSPALLPGDLVYQGGKNGNGYLVSSTQLGGIGGDRFSAPVCDSFGADAFQDGILYVACADGVRALNVDAASQRFSLRWSGPSDANGPPIIAGGLVWVAATGSSRLYGLDPLTGTVRVREATPTMEHFVTPAASDGRLFLATGTTLNAYTIATAVTPPAGAGGPPPVYPPPVYPPPPRAPVAPAVCRRAVSLALTLPRHERIVAVVVYAGRRRILRLRGHRLRRVALRRMARATTTLRVVETTSRRRRITLTVRYRDCRRLPARARHHHRSRRTAQH